MRVSRTSSALQISANAFRCDSSRWMFGMREYTIDDHAYGLCDSARNRIVYGVGARGGQRAIDG